MTEKEVFQRQKINKKTAGTFDYKYSYMYRIQYEHN